MVLTKLKSLFRNLSFGLLVFLSCSAFAQNKLNWVSKLTGNSYYAATNPVIDSSGNLYISAAFQGTVDADLSSGVYNLSCTGLYSFYIAKYSPEGNLIWAKAIGGSDTMSAVVAYCARYFSNRLYILAGYSGTIDFEPSSIGGSYTDTIGNFVVAKYDTAGDFISLVNVIEPATVSGTLWPLRFEIDPFENIVVSGNLGGTVDFDASGVVANLTSHGGNDILIAKYDSNGNYLWAKNFGNIFDDKSWDIAIDHLFNIYIVGSFDDSVDFDPSPSSMYLMEGTNSDAFIAKYNSSGNFVWAHSFGETNYDVCTSVEINSLGELFVLGSFMTFSVNGIDFDPSPTNSTYLQSNSSPTIFLAKYDSNGNYDWVKEIGNSGSLPSPSAVNPYDLFRSFNGDLYITGDYRDTIDFDPSASTFNLGNLWPDYGDVFIAHYDSVGDFKHALSTQSNGGIESGYFITVNNWGGVYVLGGFDGTVDFDPDTGTTNLTAVGDQGFIANYCFSPYPAGFINGQGVVCQEQINVPYYVNSVKDADIYVWSYTGTGVTINGTDSLVYLDFSSTATSGILTVYGTNNCSDGIVSDSFAITVMPLSSPNASISVIGQTEFCEGDSTTLQVNVSMPGLFFQWYKNGVELLNDTVSILKVFDSGIYTVQVTAPNGCPQIPLPISITVYPLPNPIITQSNDTLFSNYANGNQWYMNGTILSGETNPFLIAISSGNYSVIVTDVNTCSDTSATYTYIGINENIMSEVFKIYPNPTTGIFTLECYTANSNDILVSITDIYGREVYNTIFQSHTGKKHIDLSEFASGIYLLHIDGEGTTANFKIIKQ